MSLITTDEFDYGTGVHRVLDERKKDRQGRDRLSTVRFVAGILAYMMVAGAIIVILLYGYYAKG